ncbi:hypothetical protein ACFPZI_19355 [Streptomyces chlorus]|uniref:Uncharacterized protein n=1 Tax=Streptomyces chlorus TaxID=887452 RepID=A0ABW1DZ19_9ACTN
MSGWPGRPAVSSCRPLPSPPRTSASSASSPQVLLVGGIAFTVTAVRMTGRLNRKAEAARRNALGGL